jgi:cell division protein FtsI/penicillin-binding protein 2
MAKTPSKIESQPAVKFSAKVKTAIDSKTKKTAVKAKTEEHSMEYSVEKLQKIGEDAFGDRRGALVAINPRNGEVLAYVSMPTFDSNLFVGGIDTENWKLLNE